MINLRSSLSALALVGAVVGFSTAAHAAPMLSVIDDGTLFSGTDNGVTVDVADFNKSGKVKTQYLVQLDAGLSGNGNPVTFNTASIANTPFAAAVTFTLSGTRSQVLPLAALKAMSVAPMPVPKAATAP